MVRCDACYVKIEIMTGRRLAIVAAIAFSLLVVGCSSMSGVQRVFIWGTDFKLSQDVAYGADPRQKVDIYTPRKAPPKATVLFIFGGSWTGGSRDLYRFLGQAFASRGYQLVVADYRLYPQVRYPAFVEDGAKAFAWVKSNIASYGGDPKRVFVMGHSAGAYNAAMLMIDGEWLKPYGLRPKDALALVSMAGPLTFNPRQTDSTKDIFSAPADINTARPVKLAAAGAKDAPPMLLVHGTADTTVYPWNSEKFADAVNGAGGTATLKEYAGVDHLGVITCFAWPLRWKAPCLDDVTGFMDKVLQANPT